MPLLNRDRSILAFNERVLDWAIRDDVPLLERLRYLCIVSSNLDEWFEVRVMPHLQAHQHGEQRGLFTSKTYKEISLVAHSLVAQQYELLNHVLGPAIQKKGVLIVPSGKRTATQRQWVKQFFEHEVKPLLIPVSLDPTHPFPQVATKSLNFIVRLKGRDAFGRENQISIVKIPRALPRLIRLPAKLGGKKKLFVTLSSIVRSHLADLFPGRDMLEFSQFRVTRNSELSMDDDEVKNLRTALRQGLQHRQYGQPVRLEVSSSCSSYLKKFLLTQFELPELAMYAVDGPVNLGRLSRLIDLVDLPDLCFPSYTPSYPLQLNSSASIFDQLDQGDVIIHQPFESFDGVLALLREAAHDPTVLAIKQTIYRVGPDAAMMDLLREAVRQGKEVLVVVELKARFDEEANINWAEMLESIGAQVVYGVVGLKTHAKMLLVTRRVGKEIKRYGHLSTGNYNPITAKLYTDLSHLTADHALTADMDQVFVQLAGQSRLPRLQKLWLAPHFLHRKLLKKIKEIGAAAEAGKASRIVIKANALTDEELIAALILAGQKGVKIDLLIRGACIVAPQLAGVTENIRVRSVVGRFLEHTRIFYFSWGDTEELYLASADWMSRNMYRRIELAWPVTDAVQRQRIVQECLLSYLHDQVDAWDMQSDGSYVSARTTGSESVASAQSALMQRYGGANAKNGA